MAYFDTTWYCNAGDQSTTGHYAVTKWSAAATIAAGAMRRQLTVPTVGNERVFIAIVGGTTGGSEPAWVLTRGAKTTDNTVTWQEVTGASAVNGDATNTPTWSAARAINTAVTLGAIIKRNNGASYWICSTAGSVGASEPAWPNDTAGTTQTDSTVTWTCLGVVGNFTGGQAPHARLANACATTWFAAGNTVYVGDNHAESQATAIFITPTGSVSTLGKIICHNHSGSYPPSASDLTTGASVSTSAAVPINFNPINGAFYIYGLMFQTGVGQSTLASIFLAPGSDYCFFERCVFKLATTFASALIQLNTTSACVLIWNNCTAYFGNISQVIDIGIANFIWQNTGPILASGSSVPTNLLAESTAGRLHNVVLEALDLSQISSNIMIETLAAMGNILIKDCKLHASVTQATPFCFGATIQLVRSDSAGTAYKSTRYLYEGTETTETSITRVGGAADPTGQAQSRKIVTTANSQWLRPFKAEPYAIWNPTTGANVTVTVYGTINAGVLPNNDDIWLEVEYLGSSSFPVGTIVTTTKANLLAANAAVASDSSTWNGTGAAPTAFNPVDISGTATFSNSNLTVTGVGGGAVRGVGSLSSGKYYWEYTYNFVNTNSLTPGICLASANLGALGAGVAFVQRATGQITINVVNVGTPLGALPAGSVLGVAVDFTNQLIWFRVAPSGNWNGSGTANPATGTGGLSISSISSGPLYALTGFGAGDIVIANFGGSAFTGSVPSGFTAGFLVVGFWSPFKLTTTLSAPQPGMAGYLHARVRAAKPSTTFYIDPKIALS